MKTYTCSYIFKGKRYVVHIEAFDEEEASRRLRAIGMTAQVDGELVYEGYLIPGFGQRVHETLMRWGIL